MRSLCLLFTIWLLATTGTSHAGLNAMWRHSAQIQRDGFLTEAFPVEGLPVQMQVRQVPGDGNCLFHSISACLEHADTSSHPSLHLNDLLPKSAVLRKMAVDYLVADPDRVLYLEGGETVPVNELLTVVATQYNMTVDAYCKHMRLPAVWGGGPEIVALSNCLRRPIHVYELAAGAGRRFCFRRMACFGSPLFDGECEPIHILSADARFPNLAPGQQLANGNHFLCLFPCAPSDALSEACGPLRGGKVVPRRARRSGSGGGGWLGRVGERLRRSAFAGAWHPSGAWDSDDQHEEEGEGEGDVEGGLMDIEAADEALELLEIYGGQQDDHQAEGNGATVADSGGGGSDDADATSGGPDSVDPAAPAA
ncbi:hypothetical protein JKP88DRAFT_262966 [Tribonema minus]|uniref:Ubiquitin thioesterase OTU n=1 Tax=Tribonema minus TaxID=303371 RepID=A0A835YZQ7_9STRA|nr:hypothetical protein JKP88DRAFT_262966 [Tribonema minus]